MVNELADKGDIAGGTPLSSTTFSNLITSPGLEVAKLGLDSGKYCTETNFLLTKETGKFMLQKFKYLKSLSSVLEEIRNALHNF